MKLVALLVGFGLMSTSPALGACINAAQLQEIRIGDALQVLESKANSSRGEQCSALRASMGEERILIGMHKTCLDWSLDSEARELRQQMQALEQLYAAICGG